MRVEGKSCAVAALAIALALGALWSAGGARGLEAADTLPPTGPLDGSTKTAGQAVAHPGQAVKYAITLPNDGAGARVGVRVTDTLPSALTYLPGSLAASSGTFGHASGVITWTGTIAAGQAATVTFEARPGATYGEVINQASIEGGGSLLTREAAIQVTPYRAYLPLAARPCPPLWFDDFSNPASGWPIADTNEALFDYVGGEYRVQTKTADWWAAGRPQVWAYDVIIAADARNTTGVYGVYGLIFGLSEDWREFYVFGVDPEGLWVLWRYAKVGDQEVWTVLDQGSSSAIQQGALTNRLKVVYTGSLIQGFANGQLLTSVTDGIYTGARRLGVVAISFAQPNVDIRFDNFTIYEASCGTASTWRAPARAAGGADAAGRAMPAGWSGLPAAPRP